MKRRRLLAAIAGVTAFGGASAWYGLRGSDPGTTTQPGRRRWRVPLAEQPDALHLAGDTLLALGSGLTAFDAGTGKVRWRQDLGVGTILPGRTGTAPFTSDAGAFAVRAEDGGSPVVRVSGLGDGAQRWRRAFEGDLGSVLLTADGTVVTVADGAGGRSLVCFDGAGDRWAQPVQAADGPFDLLADAGTVFAAGRELVAYDAAGGTRKWGVSAAEGCVFGRPAVRGPLVAALGLQYIDDDYGYRGVAVHGVEAASGAVRWQYAPPGAFLQDAPPLVAGRGVVAVHESGRLTGLDPGTGEQRWEYDWDFADIIALGEYVYVATVDGVAEVDPVSGRRRVQLPEPGAYRLAGAGTRLCVAAGETLSAYDAG
ncbi:PQQ-binding-like beta-propeller repeat protein [Dactylosporangium sp. CA-233914]|uniref:outer membrane protein assembly factor BamB family protein n=1 Tax=Dactylosporangium sp. CA-233914 TaxID=3239934 RepID=UPI003D909280